MRTKKIILSSFFAFLFVMSFFVCYGFKVFAEEFTEEHFVDEYYQNISHGVPPQVFIQEYLAKVQDKYSGNYIMGNWDYQRYREEIELISHDISGTAAELGFEGNVADIMWDIEYAEGFETYAKAEAKKKYYNETFVPKIKEDATKPGVMTVPTDSNAIGFSGFFKVNVYMGVNSSPYNRSYRIFYVNDGYGVKKNSSGQVYYEFQFKDEPVYMIDYNP
ncbi:MAG: hypothetical protein LBM93_09470, partial [Oscillospiraceae bacterium]|nr:hypothetical protein [Oscillospiraceae bacterium]